MSGSYNHITLVGRLVRDPQGKSVAEGVDLARFVLAVDRPYKKEGEEAQTDFIPVVAWRRLGEVCNEYLGKGQLVLVDGRLQIRSWENDGKTVWQPEIVAGNVQMLSWKKHSSSPDKTQASSQPGDQAEAKPSRPKRPAKSALPEPAAVSDR